MSTNSYGVALGSQLAIFLARSQGCADKVSARCSINLTYIHVLFLRMDKQLVVGASRARQLLDYLVRRSYVYLDEVQQTSTYVDVVYDMPALETWWRLVCIRKTYGE